jgi:hypothetical protein
MSYTKQNFSNGQVLTATHLNKIEDGLSNISYNDLQDKPCYTAIGMVDIVPETTLTFNDDSNGILPTAPDLTTGNEYTVVWNGTEYKCIAQDAVAEGMRIGVGIGDLSVMMGEESTGEPFVIVAVDPSMSETLGATNMCVALDGSTTATISVVGICEAVHKLDNKYLDFDWFPTTENGCLLNDRRGLVSGDILYGFNKTTLEDIDSVVVVCDHVRYTCTVYKDLELWLIGNIGALTGISTGEPFYINVTGNNSQIQFMDENEHDVYIFDPNGIGTVYNKMPSEFMPPDSVFFVYFDMKSADNITCLNATFGDVQAAMAQNKLVIGVYANTNSRKTYYMLADGSTDATLYFTKNGYRTNTNGVETIIWHNSSTSTDTPITVKREYFANVEVLSNGVRYILLHNTNGRKVRIGVDAANKLYVEDI